MAYMDRTEYYNVSRLQRESGVTYMTEEEFIDWVWEGNLTGEVLTVLAVAVAGTFLSVFVAALGVGTIFISLKDTIINEVEKGKWEEIGAQLAAYGGIGAVKVTIRAYYDDNLGDKTVYREEVRDFVYGRNY